MGHWKHDSKPITYIYKEHKEDVEHLEFLMTATNRLQTNQLNREYKGRVSWDDFAKPTCTCRPDKMLRILEGEREREAKYRMPCSMG